jgi:hypothetical protein
MAVLVLVLLGPLALPSSDIDLSPANAEPGLKSHPFAANVPHPASQHSVS